MPQGTRFTDEQRTQGLVLLVRNAGDAVKTAKELDFDISSETLRDWKTNRHADRYFELAQKYGEELEAQAVALARENMILAAEGERKLIERTIAIESEETVPQALRALADSKGKNIDKLLALTGRPVAPKDSGAQGGLRLLEEMAKKGYLKVNVELPETVDSDATEEPDEVQSPAPESQGQVEP